MLYLLLWALPQLQPPTAFKATLPLLEILGVHTPLLKAPLTGAKSPHVASLPLFLLFPPFTDLPCLRLPSHPHVPQDVTPQPPVCTHRKRCTATYWRMPFLPRCYNLLCLSTHTHAMHRNNLQKQHFDKRLVTSWKYSKYCHPLTVVFHRKGSCVSHQCLIGFFPTEVSSKGETPTLLLPI